VRGKYLKIKSLNILTVRALPELTSNQPVLFNYSCAVAQKINFFIFNSERVDMIFHLQRKKKIQRAREESKRSGH